MVLSLFYRSDANIQFTGRRRIVRSLDSKVGIETGLSTGWLGVRIPVRRDSSVGWKVRGSNPDRGEIFSTRPYRPLGPPSLLQSKYRLYCRPQWSSGLRRYISLTALGASRQVTHGSIPGSGMRFIFSVDSRLALKPTQLPFRGYRRPPHPSSRGVIDCVICSLSGSTIFFDIIS